ncbi:MAG TPA: PSD1 and planctomycete cytochrome C domain-containing protein [Pirellulaceae bacterium]|jgi:hypothetical protein|nr:PSD1 and planctomycete cytochrome C domain-containing protein [Pirellulaceae bacterium]
MLMPFLPRVSFVATLLTALLALGSLRADEVDFNRDVRPILSENCFACHGFDEKAREAELRLDVAEEAFADRGGSRPLVPGDLAASEVWVRITSDDESLRMPPADSHLDLTEGQKATLKAWIEQGAKYAAHWSFIPPAKAPLPELPEGWQARNEVDRFVFDRLAREGLSPSPEADRYALIRRLSLDLTGLPPSAEEAEAFVADKSEDAYERLVDRLLESPQFGERMALDWLDASRYADTNGFSIDGGRHMWLWRDWVIDAFQRNKPYDQFLLEQIAGDLLPDATIEQKIATGFQRNNMVTHEGGTIPEENLTNYNVDRVKTLGEAVLGLTFACAQCHDHKYDPITQKDYYSLFAYFNTLDDVGLDGNAGVNPRPFLQARTVLKTGEEAALEQKIADLKAQLASPSAEALAAWEARQKQALAGRGAGLDVLPVELLKVSTPNRGAGFEIAEGRFVHVSQPGGLAAYDVLTKLPPSEQPITGLRVVFHPDPNAPGGGLGHGPRSRLKPKKDDANDPKKDGAKGSFMLTTLSISAGEVPADQVDLFGLIGASQVTASAWQPDRRPEGSLDTLSDSGWAPPVEHAGAVHLTYTFERPLDSQATPYLTAQLNFGAGDDQIAARMELYAITGVDDGSSLTPEEIAALETPQDQRSPEQAQALADHFAAHAEETERLRVDLANAEERLAALTREFPTMVMNVSAKPRETFILHRGDYSQPKEQVAMATPGALPASADPQTGRLSLAKWIVAPDHPLTSRVYVNRVWQMLFGAGIVRTPADFGSQGEWPTHPELLDWLAVDFVENDWNVKALAKKIVMSATYRQSSYASPEALANDPQNRLLARGPRFRLQAEAIRDAALKVSGLLNVQVGGPSVHPYQPGDLWREISHYGSTPATAQTFVQDHGDKLYRRSLYTYWKRTSPPPNLATFDAPNRETCIVSRPTTSTPLQALVTLNDVQFVEAARAFAQRILHREGDEAARIRWAVLEALSRPASDLEIDVLSEALARERQRYAADPEAARQALSAGESLRDETLPAEEHAAWMQVASMLLNLSESVTRN